VKKLSISSLSQSVINSPFILFSPSPHLTITSFSVSHQLINFSTSSPILPVSPSPITYHLSIIKKEVWALAQKDNFPLPFISPEKVALIT